MDPDLPRIHKMEPASESLDNGFLDGPKQGGCHCRISTRQQRCLLKLVCMEDPVNGVVSLEFIGPCHVDAYLRLISAESGPDLSSALAEGDGRTPGGPHQEMGLPERAADHLKGERSPVGGMTVFPERTFHRCKMTPQDGDETVSGPASLSGCSRSRGGGDVMRQGRIQDGSPLMSERYGMGGYPLAILYHIHSLFPWVRSF